MENKEKNNRIAEALNIRNMKQVELCEKTGIKKGSISAWISQKWQPKAKALALMSQALDVSEMWLAGYDVDMERPIAQKKSDKLAQVTRMLSRNDKLAELVEKMSGLNDSQLSVVETVVTELNKSNQN